MDQGSNQELLESIVSRIGEMDADTLRQLLAFLSGLEAKGAQYKDERVESG